MACLDTTFLIDLLRGNEKVRLIKEKIDKSSESVTIASPSIMEIVKGLRIGNVRKDEEKRVNELVSSLTILNLDKDSAIKAGIIESDLITKGEIIDLEDIMIAAIAINNNEKLITNNLKHFSKIKELELETY